nr:ribonuclease H-like domain-containing protein [Tanacetum cinerariifolium]
MVKLIKINRIFLNNNVFPHEEASTEVLLAKERIFKLIQAWDEKQIDSWNLPALLLQLLNDSQTIDEMFKQRKQTANLAEQEEQADDEEEIPKLMCKLLEDVKNIRVELAEYINSPSWNSPTFFYDDDEDMGYEHLITTPKTELDEVIKSSAKNLLPIPSEYEVTLDDESECDVPVKDDSSPVFTTFSNPLFDCNDDFTYSDDESLPDENVLMEDFKVYSNPLFDDGEINSDNIDPHCFNAESDLIESLLNRYTLIDSSPKFDFFLKEFSGELAHINLILPRIKEADFDLEEEIRLVENLLKLVERSLSMGVTQLDMTSPRWSVSTATSWDTLQGSADSQGTKIVGTGIKTALEGLVIFTPKLDLSNSALEEFQQPEFEGYGPKTSNSVSEDIPNELKVYFDALLVKDRVSDNKDCPVESPVVVEKKTIVPTIAKVKVVRPKQQEKPIRPRAVNTARPKAVNTSRPSPAVVNAVRANQVDAIKVQEDQGYVDSGCSRHMTKNMSYLLDFKEFNKGYVTFGRGANGGLITSKGTIKTGNLDFEDVYFVKELKFNLFSLSQMCDRKNNVLFTDTECLDLSPNFKLLDESQILLKVSRKNNMYSVDMKNIVPKESLTCLVAKATLDESMLWHMRLGHINFKNINKLVKDNLVRGLPSKRFENDQTCVACLKGKKHKASCKFDGKADEGFFVGYSLNSKAFRVYNTRTRKVEENLHVRFLEDKPIIAGKFDEKSDNGFFVGYSLNSKAFRVYNTRTRKVEENLHVRFLEDKPIIVGDGPKWLFDIDVLTKSMNYVPVVAGTNSNDFIGTEESIGAGQASKETRSSKDYIFNVGKKNDDGATKESGIYDQEIPKNNDQDVNTTRPGINTVSNVNTGSLNTNTISPSVTTAPLEATHADLFGNETEVDMSNISTTYLVPFTLNTRIHKDHSLDHVLGDVQSGVQTRRMIKTTNEQGFISASYEEKAHEDLHTCLFTCFLSREEPNKVIQALKDPSWIDAMQEELLQFKLQQVWTLVDLPYDKRAIGTKWIYRNKKDERGIIVRNKARLVA